MEQLSIIIPTKNRDQDLVQCLISIAHQSVKPREIIIVDASDEVSDYEKYTEKMKLVHVKAHKAGLPSQRNQGLQLISPTSKYVAFLDDDVILEKDFFENIANTFSQSNKIVGVGGVITNYDIPRFHKLILKLLLMRGRKPGSLLLSGYSTVPTLREITEPIESSFLPGGLSCYRLSAIKNMQFDHEYERFTGHAYCEDLDFSYRASQKGKLVITPDARAIHNESPTSRPSDYSHGVAQIVNRARLVKKMWGNSPYHWACFSWAMFGQIILNSAMTLSSRSPKRVLGNLAGIKYVLQRFKDI
jgi:GT2 family glycosyltransferase